MSFVFQGENLLAQILKDIFFFFDAKEKNQKETTACISAISNCRLFTLMLNCKNKGGVI